MADIAILANEQLVSNIQISHFGDTNNIFADCTLHVYFCLQNMIFKCDSLYKSPPPL